MQNLPLIITPKEFKEVLFKLISEKNINSIDEIHDLIIRDIIDFLTGNYVNSTIEPEIKKLSDYSLVKDSVDAIKIKNNIDGTYDKMNFKTIISFKKNIPNLITEMTLNQLLDLINLIGFENLTNEQKILLDKFSID